MKELAVIVDANIFLEVFLEQQKSQSALAFLKLVEVGSIKALISTFTVDSILLALYRQDVKSRTCVNILERLLLFKGAFFYSPSFDDRKKALLLIEEGLDFEDALTLQAGLSHNISRIVSFDKRFDKITTISRLEPASFL